MALAVVMGGFQLWISGQNLNLGFDHKLHITLLLLFRHAN